MEKHPWCILSTAEKILCVFNIIEGVLFGLFTFCMSCEQLHFICANISYIDTIQHRNNNKKETSSYENLQLVFGEPFSIRWFLPLSLTNKIQKDFKDLCSEFD